MSVLLLSYYETDVTITNS